jgi:hypothetical protein
MPGSFFDTNILVYIASSDGTYAGAKPIRLRI